MAADLRSYNSKNFALNIDGGESVGYVKKVEGMVRKAEVAVHNLGPQQHQKKQITTTSIDPLKWEMGIGMSAAMAAWIKSSLDLAAVYKDGEVIIANHDNEAKYSRQFYQALLTKFTIPSADAASKDGGYFSLEAEVEDVKDAVVGGGKLKGAVGKEQKKWSLANFRCKIGDLACDRISKVEGLSFTQKIAKDPVGITKLDQKIPTALELSNFKLTCSAVDMDPWMKFFDSFVIQGNNGDDEEVTMTLEFLAQDMKTVLGTFTATQCGMMSITRDALDASKADAASKFVTEWYCEELKFDLPMAK
jgi:hypothetical protein